MPSGTVGRPVASIFRTARSCWQSPPITRASYCFGFASDVKTEIFDAPSTTWQFVTTTPSERTMNPVPTPLPSWALPSWSVWKTSVVTLTTDGRARFTTPATDPAPVVATVVLSGSAVDAPLAPTSTEQAVATIASATTPRTILRM